MELSSDWELGIESKDRSTVVPTVDQLDGGDHRATLDQLNHGGDHRATFSQSLSLSTAMNAFWLISTLPIAFIRFLPSFCF